MSIIHINTTSSPATGWKTSALFQEARWREVAKKIGCFALTTLVVVGTLACLVFIPGAPLYALAGTAILLGLTGSLTGTAAVVAAVGMSLGTYTFWNGAFALGAILGERTRHDADEAIQEQEPPAVQEQKPPAVQEQEHPWKGYSKGARYSDGMTYMMPSLPQEK